MPLSTEVGLDPGYIVLDGDQHPPPKKGHIPQFSAHLYGCQTAGWIKMPLSTEVGFDPGYIVLDGAPAPLKKKAQPPIFGPCLLWPNDCMYQDTTWCGGRPQSRRHC